MTRIIELVVICLSIAVASAHLAPPALQDVVLDNPYQAILLASSGNRSCHVTCSLASENGTTIANEAGTQSCWGVFKVFCHANIRGKDAIVGTKCEGHFGGFKDLMYGKRVALCEGALNHFMMVDAPAPPRPKALARAPPPDHPDFKFISAKVCLGTEYIVMHPDATADEAIDDHDELMDIMSKLSGHNTTAKFQARCYGGSLNLKLVRPAPHHCKGRAIGDYTLSDVEAMVDEEVDRAMHPSILPDWLNPRRWFHDAHDHHHGHGNQTHEMEDSHDMEDFNIVDDVDSAEAAVGDKDALPSVIDEPPEGSFERPHGPRDCSLRCNGRPTLFRAAFPCMGVLSLSCSSDEAEGVLTDGASDAGGHRAMLANPRAEEPVDFPEAVSHANGGCFIAQCKGLFTGRWFGGKCYGLSYMAASKDEVEVVGVCTDVEAIRPFHRGPTFGMAVFCKSKSMLAVFKDD